MDQSKSSKTSMSFPSIRYNVNQEEIEEIYSSDTEKSSNIEQTTPEHSPKPKKSEKGASPSILDKYFKSFKTDKTTGDVKTVEIPEKKSLDLSSEISGSPIKEYFSKFNKRSDSTETHSDVESVKENKEKDHDRWKLFTDFKDKIAQAVEDIKSSKAAEGEPTKDARGSTDNLSDSEDNSIQQDLEQNSCASTENQVSSLASSIHNLSDLSPPIISHSSTITDSEMESNCSLESHLNLTPTEDKNEDNISKIKLPDLFKTLDDQEDPSHEEIESGVDALEDVDLVHRDDGDVKTIKQPKSDKSLAAPTESELQLVIPPTNVFFTTFLLFTTMGVFISLMIIPSYVMINGFFIGLWVSYIVNKAYVFIMEFLGYNEVVKYDILKLKDFQNVSITKIPQIVEFEPLKKYEGWVNLYSVENYDPELYHISLTNTIFLKLEGSVLRLSFTHAKVPKRALWDAKEIKASFYEHQMCHLEGATIKLLPTGIVKKRHWSKKYPICITLKDKSMLQIQSAPEAPAKRDIVIAKDAKGKESSVAKEKESPNNSPSKEVPIPVANRSDTPLLSSDPEFLAEASRTSSKSLPAKDFEDSEARKLTESPLKRKSKEILSKAKEQLKSKRRSRKATEAKVVRASMDDFMDLDTDDDENEQYHDYDSISSEDEFEESGRRSTKPYQSLSDAFQDVKKSNEQVGALELKKDSNEEGAQDKVTLYIFGRTGREKAEWFRRIRIAIDEANALKELDCPSDESIKQDFTGSDILDKSEIYDDEKSKKDIPDSKVRVGSVKSEKNVAGSSDVSSVLWTPGKTQKESILTDSFRPGQEVDFWRYMKNIIEVEDDAPKSDPSSTPSKPDLERQRKVPLLSSKNPAFAILRSKHKLRDQTEKPSEDFLWLNAVLGRVAFDTFKNPIFVAKLQERIQKKLSSLKLPSFMGPLSVSALELGYEAPQVHGSSAPTLDSCGLWLDLQVSYSGRATMTLTTQLNLMSLKDSKRDYYDKQDASTSNSPTNTKKKNMAVYFSDMEDTAESSSDDDTTFNQAQLSNEAMPSSNPTVGNTTGKKLLRMVDKIASSKYFQHPTFRTTFECPSSALMMDTARLSETLAEEGGESTARLIIPKIYQSNVTEYKCVKRAMEGVSNTDLKLNVEVCALIGCFTINIPPPPSDRLWFGFRGSPQLLIKAKPIFGSQVINFGYVTSWIEKKLGKEFEKVLVYPNLEDIVMDSMVAPVVD